MISLKPLVGTHDIVFITLDTLRYDVAVKALQLGIIPEIACRLPNGVWEKRHSPASFTYAAHQAFFAGYLPTPVTAGKHPRLFASKFHGSETTTANTFQFEEAELVSALRRYDYYSICIGGVGFFNKQTELGCVLPGLFDESHWCEQFSVTNPDSTEHQVTKAIERMQANADRRVFLFMNVSAMHQPNYFYLPNATEDSVESQIAALGYVDRWLGELWDYLQTRGAGVCILCSDHGIAYGEDGYKGLRIGHPVVWEVPYTEFVYTAVEALV